MNVDFSGSTYPFRGWRPELGQVFEGPIAIDTETTAIEEGRHWRTPQYVIGAAFDGERGFFIPREHVAEFLDVHRDCEWIFHNAAFDLDVLQKVCPYLDLYSRVDRNQVWDTQLLHRLYVLATKGHTALGKGQSTLETCSSTYLGVDLPKDEVNASGNAVRTSFGQYLGKDPRTIPGEFLEYLAKDVIATLGVFKELRERLVTTLAKGKRAFGYVDEEWLNEQIEQHGPWTHHVQLKAAIVLRQITANGMCIDLSERGRLCAELQAVRSERLVRLRELGFVPGTKGSDTAKQRILEMICREHPEVELPRTPTGKVSARRQDLQEHQNVHSFVRRWLEYQAVDRLLGPFLSKMEPRTLHASFDVLKVTGRTSSFGEINLQNLPRDRRIRHCFVPRPGHVFVIVDYAAIELAALSQTVLTQLRIESKMADAINNGVDLHKHVAAIALGKDEKDVTKAERALAKPINFGLPGGMGLDTLRQTAKNGYGLDMSEEQAETFRDAWMQAFPEMGDYLSTTNLGSDISRYFRITPEAFAEATGRDWVTEMTPKEARQILGWMARKCLGESRPSSTTSERPYTDEEIEYFWSAIESRVDAFPEKLQAQIRSRKPSFELQRAANDLASRRGVFTATGRLRANARFCAQKNTPFQVLAADGMKLALWSLYRRGYRVVNLIHDEVVVEVPIADDYRPAVAEIEKLLIEGMQAVVPDVRVSVESAVATCWSKDASKVFDDEGRLLAWSPPSTESTTCTPAAPATTPPVPIPVPKDHPARKRDRAPTGKDPARKQGGQTNKGGRLSCPKVLATTSRNRVQVPLRASLLNA